MSPKNCIVIKDSDKVHIAASFCGKSYATIVLNLSKQSRTGKCCSCKGSKCEHQKNWNKESRLSVLKEKNVDKKASEASSSGEGDSSNNASTDDAKNATRRMSLKFPPTNGTQAMFQNLESKFYDDKLFFVDSYTDGQQCTTHGNAWSALDPVEMRWCFSNNVKLAHTSFVKKKTGKESVL